MGYAILKWLFEDYILIVRKNGKLSLVSAKPKPNKDKVLCITYEGTEYPVVSDIAHELEGGFFWKRMYIYDHKQVRGRHINYNSKDTWLDTDTFKAIVNDVRIQKLSKDEETFIKTTMLLVLITAILTGVASVINLLINLGIIKV